MKKILFVFTVFVCSSLFAADIWETREEIDVNGMLLEKSIFISGSVMKVLNASPNGISETFINLDADNFTEINHKYKTFQTVKLSEYIKWSQKGINDMKEQMKEKIGNFDPDKVIPKVTFEKQGNEVVEKWNCEIWNVVVDGKPYSKIWVAPELKNQQVIEFKKRFSAMIPEDLTKYRTVDAQIDDKFLEIGTVVKSIKLSQNPKMPTVKISLKKMVKSNLKKIELVIPAGYVDKSAKETGNPQSEQ